MTFLTIIIQHAQPLELLPLAPASRKRSSLALFPFPPAARDPFLLFAR